MRTHTTSHTCDAYVAMSTRAQTCSRVQALGSFEQKLTAVQKAINELPTSKEDRLNLSDSTEFKQMSDEWKVVTLCDMLALNESVEKLDLSGLVRCGSPTKSIFSN